MPKVGDVVRYTILDRTVNALVLAVNANEVSHSGENDEPMLSLAFLDPARESGASSYRKGPLAVKPGYVPTVFIEHDVVHASHEFDDEYKRLHGLKSEAQIAAKRGSGEWSEVPDGSDAAFAALLKDNAELRQQLQDLASAPAVDVSAQNPAVPDDSSTQEEPPQQAENAATQSQE